MPYYKLTQDFIVQNGGMKRYQTEFIQKVVKPLVPDYESHSMPLHRNTSVFYLSKYLEFRIQVSGFNQMVQVERDAAIMLRIDTELRCNFELIEYYLRLRGFEAKACNFAGQSSIVCIKTGLKIAFTELNYILIHNCKLVPYVRDAINIIMKLSSRKAPLIPTQGSIFMNSISLNEQIIRSMYLEEQIRQTPNGVVDLSKTGCEMWRHKGELHRLESLGPAEITEDGIRRYYLYGRLSRIDGPAVIYPNGDYEWWFEGKQHRIGGPSTVRNGKSEYWEKGVMKSSH